MQDFEVCIRRTVKKFFSYFTRELVFLILVMECVERVCNETLWGKFSELPTQNVGNKFP